MAIQIPYDSALDKLVVGNRGSNGLVMFENCCEESSSSESSSSESSSIESSEELSSFDAWDCGDMNMPRYILVKYSGKTINESLETHLGSPDWWEVANFNNNHPYFDTYALRQRQTAPFELGFTNGCEYYKEVYVPGWPVKCYYPCDKDEEKPPLPKPVYAPGTDRNRDISIVILARSSRPIGEPNVQLTLSTRFGGLMSYIKATGGGTDSEDYAAALEAILDDPASHIYDDWTSTDLVTNYYDCPGNSNIPYQLGSYRYIYDDHLEITGAVW